MRFDADTGAFVFRYRPDRSIHAPTRIFVSPLHYPNGYSVRVRGGRVVDRSGHVLKVRPSGKSPVTVRIVDSDN
jgi:endoglycosylceramidase